MLIREIKSLDQYRSKYNYLAGLTRRGWAYEHLRRNSAFQAIAYDNQSGVITEIHWEAQIYRLDMLIPQPEAEDWGLVFFPNPDHTALYADLFWSEATYPNHVRLTVTQRLPGQVDEIYETSKKVCRVRQLNDWNGIEHILVQGPGCAIQARCTGLSLRSLQPVRMSFELSGPSVMEKQFKLIKEANRAYHPVDPDNPVWNAASLRLRDGIIALDVKDAGLPLKAAAIIIHGEDTVDKEWSAPGRYLRANLRKRLERARTIRDGGYRDFLKKRL